MYETQIHAQNDVLGSIQSGNIFRTVGDLDVDTSVVSGFDIFSQSGSVLAWATLTQDNLSGLYRIDLNTGKANLIKTIPGSRINSIALSDTPPTSLCVSTP